jgi:hypothetical protein
MSHIFFIDFNFPVLMFLLWPAQIAGADDINSYMIDLLAKASKHISSASRN